MPFWRGDGPGRPIELGRAVGAFSRHVDELLARHDPAEVERQLRESHRLDGNAAKNLIAYLTSQRESGGAVPTDRTIVVERFRDELGDWRVCILSPLGARVHAPWAQVVARRLEDRLGYPVHPLYTDDGIALRFADGDELPEVAELFPAADEIEELLVSELARSSRFAGLFRENAARALLLPRRRPGQRTPLWTQRQKAQQLMGVALRYPSFPIVLETYRECLRDVFDVPALRELLAAVERRELEVEEVETSSPSPFATSLVFDYVAAFLYEGDAPLAERKAQALTLDRALLRELLGEGELRELLDPDAVAEVEDELAGRSENRRARDADELADLLRRVGDLELDELVERAVPGLDVPAALAGLAAARRALEVRIGGRPRWIAVEDAARYRDALGVVLPPGLPAAMLGERELGERADPPIGNRFLVPFEDAGGGAMASLFARWTRTHGPFTLDEVAARWGLPRGAVAALADAGVALGTLVRGALRPIGTGPGRGGAPPAGRGGSPGVIDHCDAEVLRRIRRRTLARLRNQVAPVEAEAFARFLPAWHGVGSGGARRGLTALREVLQQLEGAPLPFAELESRILPSRVLDFAPRMLDELGAMGELVWVGRGAIGPQDGRIAIVRRGRAGLLVTPGELPADATPLHHGIVEHLGGAGASFLVAIEAAVPGHTREQVRAALWDLVWAGVITNDTFAPLRSLRSKATRRVSPGASFGGRWSLVASLMSLGEPASTTQRAHALAVSLLDRWGVLTREAALAEDVPGGFQALVPVLDGMEESGAVRRGYFVEGLGGRQYAWAGAVDRLRASASPGERRVIVALPAVDPANPWGAVMPWPEATGGARAARRGGASVVLVDGAPVLHVEPRGGKIITFAGAAPDAVAAALTQGLPALVAAQRKPLTVESIDGTRSLVSPHGALLDRTGFRRDYKGYVVPLSFAAPPRPDVAAAVADPAAPDAVDAEAATDELDDGGEDL